MEWRRNAVNTGAKNSKGDEGPREAMELHFIEMKGIEMTSLDKNSDGKAENGLAQQRNGADLN